jgi:hypothetical protein
LNISYFLKKSYEVPNNIPSNTSYKYLKAINFGYAKYLDIIFYCDGFAMYKQVEGLFAKMEGQKRNEESNRKATSKAIKDLKDMGFVGTSNINQNKFVYLKKPAFALVLGDYNCSNRINLAKDLKNDRFRISILKMEYFLGNDELIHNKSMMYHLKKTTKQILKRIIDSKNKFGYDIEAIEKIIELDDFRQISNYLEQNIEYHHKLDIIRSLWENLGDLYRKMILLRETVAVNPVYFKLFTSSNGKIVLHYIPNIIIFDVSKDKKFFKEKSEKLFEAFYKLPHNSLRDIYKAYEKSKGESMGYDGEHHIGYTLTIIGEDEKVLIEKKQAVDEVSGNSVNTPVMSQTAIVPLGTGEYMYHASRKGNEYSKSHNERIDTLVSAKIKEIEVSQKAERLALLEKENEDFGKDLLDIVKGNN